MAGRAARHLAHVGNNRRDKIGRPSFDQSHAETFRGLRGLLLSRAVFPGPCKKPLAILAGDSRRVPAGAGRRVGTTFWGVERVAPLFFPLCLSHDEGNSSRVPEENNERPHFFDDVLSQRACRRLAAAAAADFGTRADLPKVYRGGARISGGGDRPGSAALPLLVRL